MSLLIIHNISKVMLMYEGLGGTNKFQYTEFVNGEKNTLMLKDKDI